MPLSHARGDKRVPVQGHPTFRFDPFSGLRAAYVLSAQRHVTKVYRYKGHHLRCQKNLFAAASFPVDSYLSQTVPVAL